MNPAACRLTDSLPRDLLTYLLRFLSGYDLLPLSHVNKRFFTELLGPSSDVWTSRVPSVEMREGPYQWRELALSGWGRYMTYSMRGRFGPRESIQRACQALTDELESERKARKADVESSAKRQYFARRSLRFPGHFSKKRRYGRHRTAGVVAPREFSLQYMWGEASFSFDVWFALLRGTATSSKAVLQSAVGGVLLGVQSNQHQLPAALAQFAHVDPLGNLYCSVVADEKRVLATLTLERWYHLTLTFDKPTPAGVDGLQCVFLDGTLIDTSNGSLPSNWDQLKQFQLGSGFMDDGCVGNLRPGYKGMYGFNGLVDDFRFWTDVLTPDDVQQLHAGQATSVQERCECMWSLMHDGRDHSFYGSLSTVRCTRPTEGMCTDVRPAFEVLPDDDPWRPH